RDRGFQFDTDDVAAVAFAIADAMFEGDDLFAALDKSFGEQEPRGQLEVVARRAHSNAQGKLAHADLERLLANQIVLEAAQAAILPFGHVRQVDAARARHQRLLRSGLYTEQVGLQLGVAILLRPDLQRERGKLIDHGDGQAVFGEVHSIDVGLARIASLDAHMFKLAGGVRREFVKPFFAAGRAYDPAVIPLGEAERADQRALGSVALLAQDADLRFAAANRADGRPEAGQIHCPAGGKVLGVRLQQRASKEYVRLWRVLNLVGLGPPIGGEQLLPVCGVLVRQLYRCLGQHRCANAAHEGKQSGEARQTGSQVQGVAKREKVRWLRTVSAGRFQAG